MNQFKNYKYSPKNPGMDFYSRIIPNNRTYLHICRSTGTTVRLPYPLQHKLLSHDSPTPLFTFLFGKVDLG